MPTLVERFSRALRSNAESFAVAFTDKEIERLGNYYELLLKWNPRLHLVAPCSAEEFATRHVLESLVLLPHLTEAARVIDVGSGGGLPIIPCLIMRPSLRVSLIEASQKKVVFLREALRPLMGRESAQVSERRFEAAPAPEADFVTCRALERFQEILPQLIDWSPPESTLLLFAGDSVWKQIERLMPWASAELIPNSERRFLIAAPRSKPTAE